MKELDHKTFLCKSLWKMKRNGIFTDLTIVSGNGVITHVHKPIIAMAFYHFGMNFRDIREEDVEILLIPDSTREELEEAVKMLYLNLDSRHFYNLMFSRTQNSTTLKKKQQELTDKHKTLVSLFEEINDKSGCPDLLDIKEEQLLESEAIKTENRNEESGLNQFPENKDRKSEVKTIRGKGRPKGKKDSSKRKVYTFFCVPCNKKFKGRLAYKKHLRKFHNLPKQKSLSDKVQTPCPYCETVLSSASVFNLHIALVHKEMAHMHPEIIFKKSCEDCKEKFYNIVDLDKHTRAVHGKSSRYWKCNFCKELLQDKPSLRLHRLKFHRDEISGSTLSGFVKNLPCPYCEKMYIKNSEVHRHITKNHAEKLSLHPEIEFKHSCLECQQHFFDNDSLMDHNVAHHGHEFECKLCESKFKTRHARFNHMEIIHKNEKHLCEICSKVFQTKAKLKAHIKRHTDLPTFKFPCSQCKKGAQTEKGLEKHMKSNHNGKQHLCSFCNAAFNSRLCRSHHEKSIHGEKTLACEYCDKKFSMNLILQRHIKNVHVKDKDKECPECGEKFFNLDTFRTHVNRHSNTRPFACEVCGQRYHTKMILKRHMSTHTVPYKCNLCEKAFANKGILDDHVRKHAGVKVDCRFWCGHSYMDRRNRDRHERICEVNGKKGFTFSQTNKN